MKTILLYNEDHEWLTNFCHKNENYRDGFKRLRSLIEVPEPHRKETTK